MTKKGKRRTWRKLLSALLVMSMLLGMMSTSVFAADLAEPSLVEEAAAQPENDPQPETIEETVNTPEIVPAAEEPADAGTVNTPESVPAAEEPADAGTVNTPEPIPAAEEPADAGTVNTPEPVPAAEELADAGTVNTPEPVPAAEELADAGTVNTLEPVPAAEENAYADISEFYAAIAEMGDAEDEESVRAVIAKCLTVYYRLSPEDQAAQAEAYAYIMSYAEDLGQSEIETLVQTGGTITVDVYGPCGYLGQKKLTAGRYIQVPCYIEPLSTWLKNTGYSNYTYNNVRVTFSPPSYFPSRLEHREGTTPDLSKNYSHFTMTYLVDNWSAPHQHNYVWKPISDTQHQQKCDCGDTKGNPQNHIRSVKSSTPATCNSYASTTYYCSTCGHTWTEYGKSYATHTWGDWYDNGNGKEQRDCDFGVHHEYRDIQTQKVTLTYKDGNSTYATDKYDKMETVEIIRTITNPYLDFIGWSDDQGAVTANYPVGTKFVITTDMTLYAVWQPKVIDDGKGIEVTKTRTSAAEVKKGEEITWDITVKNNSNVQKAVTLTEQLRGAYFESNNNNSITVTISAGESTTVTAKYTVRYNDSGTIQNTVIASTGVTGENKTATDDPGTKISADYKVQWFDNNGNQIKGEETRSGAGHVSVASADKIVTGYTFLEGDSRNVLEADLKADGSIVLKLYFEAQLWAKWVNEDGTELQKVYFDKGTIKPAADAYTGTTPSKADDEDYTYTFNGWTESIDASGNVTYTATYTATPKSTATYYVMRYERSGANETLLDTDLITRSGIVGNIVSVTEADKIISGYVFLNNDPGNVESITLTNNGIPNLLVLYFEAAVTATWKNGYDDTELHVENGLPKSITDEEVKELYTEEPAREGYKFDGWDVTRDSNGDITITAKWKPTDNGNGISVTKTRTSAAEAEVGDTITWDITVTNNSNVTKTVTLTERLVGAVFENSEQSIEISVDPDDSQTVTVTYVVQEADAGTTLYNTVIAATGGSGDNENPEATDEGTEIDPTTPVDNGNGISVTKTRTSVAEAEVGDTITWDITVTNNSNVTKTVTLTEQLTGAALSESRFTLAPGASQTVTASYVVQEADAGTTLYNTVIAATGGSGDNENPKATDEGTLIDSEDLTPENPTPEDPTPENPTPEDPTPEDPTPENPTPEDPTPEDPTPEDPTPENPTPEDPTPENPTPEDPTPEDPTPEDPTPENPTPGTTPDATPGTTPDTTPGTTPVPTPGATPAPAPVVTPAAVPAAVPVVTPAAAVPAAAVPAADTPLVAVEDEDVPLADQDIDSQADVREVADEDVPLAKGLPKSWALLNLILAILTVLASGLMLIFYFIGKKNGEEDEDDERIQQIHEDEEEDEEELKRKGIFRLLSIIPAVVSVIFFILTEDMRNPMIFVDKWTLWMVVFAAANVILTLLSKKKRKEDDDDNNNKQKPNYGIV